MSRTESIAPRPLPRTALPFAFEDHGRFHRTLARAIAAGGIAGGAAGATAALTASGASSVSLFVPVVLGVAVAAAVDAWWPLLLTSAIAGGLAGVTAALSTAGGLHPLLTLAAGAGLGALAGRRRVPRGPRRGRLLSALGCALTTALGAFTVGRLMAHGFFEAVLPGPLALVGYGAALGLFALLGAAAAHLRGAADPVEQALERSRPRLRGDLLRLAERSVQTYAAARDILRARRTESEGEAEAAAELQADLAAMTLRSLRLAVQVSEVDGALGLEGDLDLAEQLQVLAEKAERTADEVARHHYLLARRNLEAQADQIHRIRLSRDRTLATLHGQLALLERTRVSLVGLRSADSARRLTELATLSEVVADATREMESLAEATLDLAEAPPIPATGA